MGLAAKAAANFRRRNLELRHIKAQQTGTDVTERKMPLRRHPKITHPIRTEGRKTGMWLDIALVGLFSFVALLDDDIRFRKARIQIAMTEFAALVNVGCRRWRWVNASCSDPILNHRRLWLHRFVNIGHVRQLFVLHLDQF